MSETFSHSLIHEEQSLLYDYWLRKKGARIAPRRSDLDPCDIPKLLPNLMLYKVSHAPLDYRMILIGTHVVDLWGKDFTGHYFDEIFAGEAAVKIRNHYDTVVTTAQPSIHNMDAGWLNKDYMNYSRLLLPLSDDGKVVNRLLGSLIFDKKKSTTHI